MTGGDGDDVVLGDLGSIELADSHVDLVFTTDSGVGGADTIDSGAGDDLVLGGSGSDVIRSGDDRDIVFGDAGRVSMVLGFTASAVTIDPEFGGDDQIDAGAGDDLVFGGAASDQIFGSGGADVLFGDNGVAQFQGQRLVSVSTSEPTKGGNDTVSGGDGDDVLILGAGFDAATGDAGNDRILGDNGGVILDPRSTALAALRVTPSDWAAGGNDLLFGGAGDDEIQGGAGDDTILGEQGDDVIFGDLDFVLSATYTAGSGITGIELVGGNLPGGNDLLLGGAGADRITGGPGNDRLAGDAGDDELRGGVGPDYPNPGEDLIYTGSGGRNVLTSDFEEAFPNDASKAAFTFESASDFATAPSQCLRAAGRLLDHSKRPVPSGRWRGRRRGRAGAEPVFERGRFPGCRLHGRIGGVGSRLRRHTRLCVRRDRCKGRSGFDRPSRNDV